MYKEAIERGIESGMEKVAGAIGRKINKVIPELRKEMASAARSGKDFSTGKGKGVVNLRREVMGPDKGDFLDTMHMLKRKNFRRSTADKLREYRDYGMPNKEIRKKVHRFLGQIGESAGDLRRGVAPRFMR